MSIVTKKKSERVLAKFVMLVRMSRQQALEVGGVAEGDIITILWMLRIQSSRTDKVFAKKALKP